MKRRKGKKEKKSMYKGERKRMMRREELRTIFRERSWKKGEKEKKEE